MALTDGGLLGIGTTLAFWTSLVRLGVNLEATPVNGQLLLTSYPRPR